jgi:hypothetical protein
MMELTEPMEWVTVIYYGVEFKATNFLDGILVLVGPKMVSYRGWYIQSERGDMDGPAFRKYPEPERVFGIQIVEAK